MGGQENGRVVLLMLLRVKSEGQQRDSAAVPSGMMPESSYGGTREPYSHSMYFQWDKFSSVVLKYDYDQ